MLPSKLAHAAADYIFINGWWRRSPGMGPAGQVCLMGALGSVGDPQDDHSDAIALVYETIAKRLHMGPIVWNDHHAKGPDDVIAMLHWAGFTLAERENAPASKTLDAMMAELLTPAEVADIVLGHVPEGVVA